jgi:hypothetical protein
VLRVDRLAFAGQVLRDVEVQVFTPALQAPLPDGLLGVGILSRYRVGLDLGAGLLWLTERGAGRPARGSAPRAVLSSDAGLVRTP